MERANTERTAGGAAISHRAHHSAPPFCFAQHTQKVRRLSVKQITSPITFDALGNVVPEGLYDAHMGPIDKNGR